MVVGKFLFLPTWIGFVAIFAATLMGNGCVFNPEPFHPVRIFDFGNPPPELATTQVKIGEIKNLCPAKRSFMYRVGKNEIIFDEYNRWEKSPESLTRSYLEAAFSSGEQNKEPGKILSGTIKTFEFDLNKNTAYFSFELTIQDKNGNIRSHICKEETPFADKDSAKLAEAMAKNLEKSALNIEKIIESEGK
jgi:hypothetical protein